MGIMIMKFRGHTRGNEQVRELDIEKNSEGIYYVRRDV